MAKKSKLTKKEIVFYSIAAVIGAVGLLFVVFGIVGSHFPGINEDNWIAASEKAWLTNWSGIGYRWWGLILVGIAAVIACISLTVFAREGDRDSERALRRQQRLAMAQEKIVDEQPDQITAA